MEFSKTVMRHLYIDVTIKDYLLDEIYLYQVDYKNDKSTRSAEYIFAQPAPQEIKDDEGNVVLVPGEELDLREIFLDKITELRATGIPIEFYAINAREVMLNLIEPLKKSKPKAKRVFNEIADEKLPHEWMTDCISMVRTIPVTEFDEMPELASPIRRRLKEKFHEVAAEIKREKATHIFTRYEQSMSGFELSFYVTAADMTVLEDIKLHGRITDDVMVSKACEIVKKYSDADIIIDKTSIRLYSLFKSVEMFTKNRATMVIYSMESMLTALGKRDIAPNPSVFRDYIKNSEELRFGRYEDENVYSLHTFRIPVSYNSEYAWKNNFKRNFLWTGADSCGDEYVMIGGSEKKGKGEIFGKLSATKGREKFILKVSRISVKKYIPGYAVITISAENHFYPGAKDMERIDDLFSGVWKSKFIKDELPDALDLQMRTDDKTYSLSAAAREKGNFTPWIGLLLTMGRRKKNSGLSRFMVATLSDKMLAVHDSGENGKETVENTEVVCKSLVKSEYLLQLEQYLAEVIAPKDGKSHGIITKKQKKKVKQIADAFAYMVGSFCYDEEQGEWASTYKYVNKVRHITETEQRLEHKLDLLYD